MFSTKFFSLLSLMTLVAATPVKRDQTSGKATYFATGLGACGWTNTPDQYIVAVNQAQYEGTCGKMLTITNTANGNTAVAQAVDLCPGCTPGGLDMSTGLFSYLSDGNMDEGVFPITWSFNE